MRTPFPSRSLIEADTASYIGMSRGFLRASRIGHCDGPPYIRIGRSIRYRVTDLDAWLDARLVSATRRPDSPEAA